MSNINKPITPDSDFEEEDSSIESSSAENTQVKFEPTTPPTPTSMSQNPSTPSTDVGSMGTPDSEQFGMNDSPIESSIDIPSVTSSSKSKLIQCKDIETENLEIQLPNIQKSVEKNGVMHFTLTDCNVSVANSIRRIILSEIDTVVIRGFPYKKNDINIIENTGKLNNEILKQRLSAIPIHIKEFDGIENLELEIDQNNTMDRTMLLSTYHFKLKDVSTGKYYPKEFSEKVFPKNKLTDDYILFARLRPRISQEIPGEKLKLTAKFTVSNAKEFSGFNVASTCAYGFTEDKLSQNEEWDNIQEELVKSGKTESEIENEKVNWYNHDAKRIYLPNSFDFSLKTIGVFTNMEIINKALDKLIEKMDTIKENTMNGKYKFTDKDNSMLNCMDVHLEGETYTTGKVIEYILYRDYYQNGNALCYVGFIKKHPHDRHSVLRLAFNDATEYNQENIKSLLCYACEVSKKMYSNLKEYF
tara:strand:+ start:599 stop:2014 length:1416 start_codon:yes stop_codon:yes gene_type:complete